MNVWEIDGVVRGRGCVGKKEVEATLRLRAQVEGYSEWLFTEVDEAQLTA